MLTSNGEEISNTAIERCVVVNPGPVEQASAPVAPDVGTAPDQVVDINPDNPQPGVVVPGEVVPGSSPIKECFLRLVEASATSRPLDNYNVTGTVSEVWFSQQPKVQGKRDSAFLERYPTLPSMGIMTIGYNYDNHVGQAVSVHNAYDVEWRWFVQVSSNLPGLQLRSVRGVEEYTSGFDLRGPAGRAVIPVRGKPEMETSYTLSRAFDSRVARSNFSCLSPAIKLLGYLLSLGLPADDGLLGTAAIDAESAGCWGQEWFPGTPVESDDLPSFKARYVSPLLFHKWLSGELEVYGDGWGLGRVGVDVVVVPVPVGAAACPASLLWFTLSRVFYPVKNRYREGTLRDPNGELLGGDGQPVTAQWYPVSSLTSVDGPVASGSSELKVIFVLTGGPAEATTPPLRFPGSQGDVLVHIDGVAVEMGPVFEWLFEQPGTLQVPEVCLALKYLMRIETGRAELAEAVRFWQCQGAVELFLPQGVGRYWKSVIGPARADDRGWISEEHLLDSTEEFRKSAPYVPATVVGAWPGLTFQNPEVDRTWVAPVVDKDAVHWTIPTHDQILAVGLALGVIVAPEAAPFTLREPDAGQILLWIVEGAASLTAAVDIALLSNGAARGMMFHHDVVDVPGNVRAQVETMQERFWGRPARQFSEFCGDAEEEEGIYLPFGALMSKELFSSRMIVWYPTNGQVFRALLDSIPQEFLRGDSVLLGRMDVPTLTRWAPDLIKLNQDSKTTLNGLGWVKGGIQRAEAQGGRNSKDDVLRFPDVVPRGERGDWVGAWEVVTRGLDGLMADGGFGAGKKDYESLRILPVGVSWNMGMVPALISGPLTWGPSLAAMSAEDSREQSVSDSWTLTFQRPPGVVDPVRGTELQLISRGPGGTLSREELYRGYRVVYSGSAVLSPVLPEQVVTSLALAHRSARV